MRGNGQLTSARGLVPYGHLGWAYRTPLEFRRRAGEYLADGLALGQQVEVAAPGPVERVEDLVCSLPGGRAALEAGQAVAVPLADFYGSTPGVDLDPRAAADGRAAHRRRRAAAGVTGLRAIVDATDLARTTRDRDAFATFEVLIDAAMAAGGGSALCGYDVGVLGEAAAELTCLHPWTDARSAPFRLFADGEGGVVLGGEVDGYCLPLFERAVRRVWAVHEEDELRVDLSEAEFLGHRALLALERMGREAGRQVVLRRPQAVVTRIVELIGAPGLTVEGPR